MMKIWLYIVLLIFIELLGGVISAQTVYAQAELHCGTISHIATTSRNHTEPQTNYQNLPMPELMGVVTLPVVVHIIHDGDPVGRGGNLSELFIASQIEVINEDYRNSPTRTSASTDSLSVDTEIDFCLAAIGPDGFPLESIGIDRIDRNGAGFIAPPYEEAYIDTVIKPATIWDPSKYINIWVLDIAELLLRGYAQFPDSSGLSELRASDGRDSTDGLVIDVAEWGKFANNAGRTVTHEMGHFLGLVHTWGDENNCTADDGCDDTPRAFGFTNFCPNDKATCGSRDMIENYMDLTDGFCQNLFTSCQRSRMRQVLQRSPRRKELVFSTVCQVPDLAPQALFSFSFVNQQGQSCANRIQFVDQSVNQPFSWLWDFGDGRTSFLPNPFITYTKEGVYTVTLTVKNFQGESQLSQEIVVCVLDNTPSSLTNAVKIEPATPNPVGQELFLSAWFPKPQPVSIQLLDLNGKAVSQLYLDTVNWGRFDLRWQRPAYLPAGMYLLVWQSSGVRDIQKIWLGKY